MMDIASSNRAKVVTAVLAGLALGLSALLLYQSQTQDALPGCGGGSGCGAVLTSKWAYWFDIPVSLPAMLLYTTMLCAVVMRDPDSRHPQRPALFAMALCAVAALFAAGWFFSVQLLIIKQLCKYCLATHAVGVTASVLCLAVASAQLPTKALVQSSISGLLMITVLVAGQILGEPPEAAAPLVQYATDTPTQPVIDNQTTKPAPIIAPPSKPTPISLTPPDETAPGVDRSPAPAVARTVSLYGNRLKVDLTGVPILGNPDAKTVLVCLFDYTCSHCRTTRVMLEKIIEKHGDSLAVVCLPVPLDTKCNYLIKRRNYANRYACDMAQLSLAFWKVSPEKWERFDRQLYSNKNMLTPVRARIAAEKLIDAKKLKQAMTDPWINQQIARDVKLYATTARAAKRSMLPMLITERGVMAGTPRHPLDLEDFIKGRPVSNNQPDTHDHDH